MKLVIVITGMSFGGAERVTAYLSNYFSVKGHQIHILALNKTDVAYPLARDVVFEYIDASHCANPFTRDIFLIKTLRRRIRSIRPELVLGMMSYSGTLAAYACIGLGIPVLLSERNDPNTSTAFTGLEKLIIKYAYRHLATNAIFQTIGAKEYYFKSKDKGYIIPNPLYLEDFPPARDTYIPTKKIISAGRLSKQKNHALLVLAFAKLHVKYPDYILAIYGDGPERESLQKLIHEYSLDASVLLPGISKTIFSHLQEAEMFVLSSQYEGMPNALIEAMAMGLPVITTDYSEGRGTIVEHHANGLVVERNSVDALADAMCYMIEHPEEAKRMGQLAVGIRNLLDSEKVCALWLQTITKHLR